MVLGFCFVGFCLLVGFVFWDRASLCSPGWPETYRSASLCFLSAESEDMSHFPPLFACFLTKGLSSFKPVALTYNLLYQNNFPQFKLTEQSRIWSHTRYQTCLTATWKPSFTSTTSDNLAHLHAMQQHTLLLLLPFPKLGCPPSGEF